MKFSCRNMDNNCIEEHIEDKDRYDDVTGGDMYVIGERTELAESTHSMRPWMNDNNSAETLSAYSIDTNKVINFIGF